MSKVLVTGGFGFIGSVLTPKLLKKGYDVKILDSSLLGFDNLDFIRDKIEVIKGDLRDLKCLKKSLEGIDYVIHLAAISNDACTDLDPELAYETNVKATENLVNLSKSNKIKRFIYMSSSGVYGLKKEEDVTEDLILEPITTYSKSKRDAEKIVLKANDKDFPTIVIRSATACGFSPRMCLDLTVNILTIQALTKGVITVFGGNQKRPNIHIEDITDYFIELLEADENKIAGQIFNAGSENKTVLEIAEIIRSVIGEHVRIDVIKSEDNRSYHICSKKIKDELGLYPKKSIKDAVEDIKNAFDSGLISDATDPKYFKIELLKKNLKKINKP
ncbi:MAG: SDR family oxidoreductase [Nanoarchaeota archaeon]|nr:SDR family oxidoreductase [Nanoarchaeota archaeon]